MSDDPLRQARESARGAQYDVGRLRGRGAGAAYLATERLLERLGTRSLGQLYLISIISTLMYARNYDPVWFEFLGLVAVALGVAVAVMIARARRVGLSDARALRLAFLAPAKWITWWPRALRSSNDVWDRLPPAVRKARTLLGVFMAGWGLLASGVVLGMLIARHHHPLANVLWGLSMGTILVTAAVGVEAMVMAKAFGRAKGLDGYEINKLLQEPTAGSKFWSRPSIARLLLPLQRTPTW